MSAKISEKKKSQCFRGKPPVKYAFLNEKLSY